MAGGGGRKVASCVCGGECCVDVFEGRGSWRSLKGLKEGGVGF